MNSDLQNRLNSHHAILRVSEENQTIWKDKKPKAFTKKMAELVIGVADLEHLAAMQSADITGIVKDKEAAQEALIACMLTTAGAMLSYFADNKDQTSYTRIRLTESDLRNARDAAISQMAQMLLELLGPLSKLKPSLAEDYNISPAMFEQLNAKLQAYSDVLGKPRAALANRKSATSRLQARSESLDALYEQHLDHLILSFRGTGQGDAFISDWFNARKIISTSRSSASPQPPETVPALETQHEPLALLPAPQSETAATPAALQASSIKITPASAAPLVRTVAHE
jgi:hypothetical protein